MLQTTTNTNTNIASKFKLPSAKNKRQAVKKSVLKSRQRLLELEASILRNYSRLCCQCQDDFLLKQRAIDDDNHLLVSKQHISCVNNEENVDLNATTLVNASPEQQTQMLTGASPNLIQTLQFHTISDNAAQNRSPARVIYHSNESYMRELGIFLRQLSDEFNLELKSNGRVSQHESTRGKWQARNWLRCC